MRFQESPWYIKLWRYRWYLLLPFWSLKYYLFQFIDAFPLTWNQCFNIAKGEARYKMGWIYTYEELKRQIIK